MSSGHWQVQWVPDDPRDGYVEVDDLSRVPHDDLRRLIHDAQAVLERERAEKSDFRGWSVSGKTLMEQQLVEQQLGEGLSASIVPLAEVEAHCDYCPSCAGRHDLKFTYDREAIYPDGGYITKCPNNGDTLTVELKMMSRDIES